MDGSPRVPGVPQAVLRKQATHLEKLRSENLQLKQELSLETRAAATGSSVKVSSQLNKLNAINEQYHRKIDQEKHRSSQIDKQIRSIKDQLLKQRQAMGGINTPSETDVAVGKQVQVLENRLDKALVKFNEAVAHNKELREQIDNLRRERLTFDTIYKKLQRELADKKRSMAEIIEAANVAYEERDKLQAEATRLRSTAEKEQQDFESEWKQLGEQLDSDLKQHDVLARELSKRVEHHRQHSGSAQGAEDSDGQDKRPGRRSSWGVAKDKASVHASIEKVASYEEAFARLVAATGISDAEELVSRFLDAETQCFSRFNHLNELNLDIGKTETALAEVKEEIERYKGSHRGAETLRQRYVAELETKLQQVEARTEGFERKFEELSATVQELGKSIEGLCEKVGCNMAMLRDVAGDEGCTEANLMVYLGVLEQRINELLRLSQAKGEASPDRRGATIAKAIVADGVDDANTTFLTAGGQITEKVRLSRGQAVDSASSRDRACRWAGGHELQGGADRLLCGHGDRRADHRRRR